MVRAFRKPEEVAKLVQQKFNDTRSLRNRMDKDYQRWRMEEFSMEKAEAVHKKNQYTSNTLRTLADKISSYIAYSNRRLRVQNTSQDGMTRKANDALERLSVGIVNHADRRLMQAIGNPFQQDFAWYSTIFGGWIAGRAMLRKSPNGQTICDMTPFNPRHLVFEMGEEEPLWCAYNRTNSRASIYQRFPKWKFGDEDADTDANNSELEVVTECYYTEYAKDGSPKYYSGVVIDDRWARKPEEMYSVHFPVPIIQVGGAPVMAPGDVISGADAERANETSQDIAESIFAPLRKVMDAKNRALSYRMALTAMGVNRAYKVFSPDGHKTLESNPSNQGTEINLMNDMEDVEFVELSQLTKDADVLLERLTDDETDGGLPPQAFGILSAPISSLAMKQLGNNLEHKVTPRLKAIEKWMEQGLANMVAQYETGAYVPFRVTGMTAQREQFDQYVDPMELMGHGRLEVELTAVFPEEEILKWQIAQLALTPTPNGQPLMSLSFVRDEILKVTNRDKISAENMEDMARYGDPLALAWEKFKAATQAGDQALSMIYFDEAQRQDMVKYLETMQLMMGVAQGQQMQGQKPTGQVPQRSPYGVSSSISPAAETQPGFQAQPSMEAGYNTTAPRPGGLNDQNAALNAVGLARTV